MIEISYLFLTCFLFCSAKLWYHVSDMDQMNCKAYTHKGQHFMSSASDKTPKGFLTWLLYMGMVQDLVHLVCQF